AVHTVNLTSTRVRRDPAVALPASSSTTFTEWTLRWAGTDPRSFSGGTHAPEPQTTGPAARRRVPARRRARRLLVRETVRRGFDADEARIGRRRFHTGRRRVAHALRRPIARRLAGIQEGQRAGGVA